MRAPLSLLCLLVVAVTAGGLWFAFGSSDTHEPPDLLSESDPTLDPETGDPLEDRSATEALPDESPDLESAEGHDGPAADEIERVTLTASAARPDPSPAVLRIRVFDVARRRPVVSAEVFCLQIDGHRHRASLGDLPGMRESGPGGRHMVDAVIDAGRRYVTDERGEVEVVGPIWRLAVAARTADKIGFAEASRDKPGPLQVFLVPEDHVEFSVVGVDGAPREGVKVLLYGVENAKSGAAHWEAVTDAAGRARLRHLSLILGKSRGQRLLAIARAAAVAPVVAEFRAEPLPSEPIELRLPAAGRARIEVCDSVGEPLISAFEVTVRVPKDAAASGSLEGLPPPTRSLASHVSGRKAFDERFVELHPIAVGAPAEVVVSARGPGRRMTTEAVGLVSPVADGQVSTLRVTAPPTWIVLRGRAMDATGSAFRDGRLRAVLHSATYQSELPAVPVAADGRFEILVELGMRILDDLHLELSAPDALAEHGRPQALVALGRLQPNDHRQLGSIVLTPTAPMTVGVVRDDLGRVVEGAGVVVFVNQSGRTLQAPLTPSVTAADGTYAIFGTLPNNPLSIRVTRRGHLADLQEFVTLPSTHDVTLTRTARLHLSVHVPADCPPLALEARLVATDGQAIDLRFEAQGDRHSWESDAIRRGVYELSIGIRNVPGLLHRERGIVADPDQRPRPMVIDLRDRVHGFHVIATKSDGTQDRAAFGHALVRMTELDGRLGWRAFPMRQGEIRFVAFQSSLECFLFATGRAEVSGWLRAGENRLLSRAIQPIRVLVPGLRAAADGAAIRISLVFEGDTGFPESIETIDQASGNRNSLPRASLGKSGGAVLGADEAATVLVSRPGSYAVVARFDRPRKPRVSVEIGRFEGVIDGLSPQEVRISFDAEKVRAALAK